MQEMEQVPAPQHIDPENVLVDMLSGLPSDFDNVLDPNIATDLAILAQREVYAAWQQKIDKYRPIAPMDRDFSINPVLICGHYQVFSADLATMPAPSTLADCIQQHLINAYYRRGLRFGEADIFSIADPDEMDRSVLGAAKKGVMNIGAFGYDMRVEVILTKALDEEDFDFFFALKLLQTPIMEIDDFLDHHLKENFGNEAAKFKRFLKLLLRYIPERLNNLAHDAITVTLSEGMERSVQEWIDPYLFQEVDIEQGGAEVQIKKEDGQEVTNSINIELVPIFEYYNEEAYHKLLDFFGHYKSSMPCSPARPLLSPEDIERLKVIGLNLPNGAFIKVKPNLGPADRARFYHFIHTIWRVFSPHGKRHRTSMVNFVNACFDLGRPVWASSIRKDGSKSTQFHEGLNVIVNKYR